MTLDLKGKHQIITQSDKNYIDNLVYFNEVITEELAKKITLVLPNLINYKIEKNYILFQTPVIIGKNITTLNNQSSSSKIDLINKYLNTVNSFKDLPYFMQISLSRLENFYYSNNELLHRGVLIIEDSEFDFPFNNSHLLKFISNNILSIIGDDLSLMNFKNYFRNIFIDKPDRTIQEVIDDIKKIYINDLFEKKIETKKPEIKKKNYFKNINYSFITLMILSFVFFGFLSISIIKSLATKNANIPTAQFKINDELNHVLAVNESYPSDTNIRIIENEWNLYLKGKVVRKSNEKNFKILKSEPGSYKLSLRVKDVNNNWSKTFSERINIKEREVKETQDLLDSYNFEKAFFDNNLFRTGNKSVVISPGQQLMVNRLHLNNYINISFYLYSDDNKTIEYNINGYHNDKKISNSKSKINLLKDKWVKLNIKLKGENINSIGMIFYTKGLKVNLDDLKITSHKK